MESKIVLSEIRNQYQSGLSGFYPDTEISQIFFLTTEHLLNYSKIETFLKGDEPISVDNAEKFNNILQRLRNWEPVQYILGYAWFYGLTFKVDKRVLIPRQETEELVDWILHAEPDRRCKILDIGTGSGCIAVTLVKNLPDARVAACDISADALNLARSNAHFNKSSVDFFVFDLLNDDSSLPGKYHVMVSNPPYVRQQEKGFMKRNVLDYEPEIALFTPDHDPLLFYKRIILLARRYLFDGGTLYLEINEHFPDEIVKLLNCAGFYGTEVKNDLNGKSRMIRAKK